MKKLSTKIKGYSVQLEIDPTQDPSTECWVEKGDHCSSLACLSGTGYLYNGSDIELEVPDSIIHQIEDWAEANGY